MAIETALERLGRLMRNHRPHEVTIDRAEREMGEPERSLQRAETGGRLPHRRFMQAWEQRFGVHADVREAYEAAQADYKARRNERAERRRSAVALVLSWEVRADGSPSPAGEEDTDMNRREIGRAGAAALAGFALPAVPGTAGVAHLEAMTDNLKALNRTLPFHLMQGPLEAHARLLRASMPAHEAGRQRVLAALSMTAAMAGFLHYDGFGNRSRGRAYHQLALTASRQSGVAPVTALALQATAGTAFDVGDRHGAVQSLDEAKRLAAKHASPALHSYLAASRAELAAKLGDARGAEQGLDQSRRLLQHVERDNTGTARIGWRNLGIHWDEMNVQGFEGTCYTYLKDGARAERSLRAALQERAVNDSPHSFKVAYSADLATALAVQGRVDEACAMANRALDLSTAAGVTDRVGALLLGPLRRYRSAPCVLDLQERLLAVRA